MGIVRAWPHFGPALRSGLSRIGNAHGCRLYVSLVTPMVIGAPYEEGPANLYNVLYVDIPILPFMAVREHIQYSIYAFCDTWEMVFSNPRSSRPQNPGVLGRTERFPTLGT